MGSGHRATPGDTFGWPIRCACRATCGDVAEADDHHLAACKGLPSAPKQPPVEAVLIPRSHNA